MINLDLNLAQPEDDTVHLPCANDTIMEARLQENKVDNKLVNLLHPARLAVLMKCGNHVVH